MPPHGLPTRAENLAQFVEKSLQGRPPDMADFVYVEEEDGGGLVRVVPYSSFDAAEVSRGQFCVVVRDCGVAAGLRVAENSAAAAAAAAERLEIEPWVGELGMKGSVDVKIRNGIELEIGELKYMAQAIERAGFTITEAMLYDPDLISTVRYWATFNLEPGIRVPGLLVKIAKLDSMQYRQLPNKAKVVLIGTYRSLPVDQPDEIVSVPEVPGCSIGGLARAVQQARQD